VLDLGEVDGIDCSNLVWCRYVKLIFLCSQTHKIEHSQAIVTIYEETCFIFLSFWLSNKNVGT